MTLPVSRGTRTKVEQKRCEFVWQEACLWSPVEPSPRAPVRLKAVLLLRQEPRRASALGGFARLDPCLRRDTGPYPRRPLRRSRNSSPSTRAMAAGLGSCWRSSTDQAVAVGAGADGDPRERARPSAGAAGEGLMPKLIHVEARDARDALWAMEEGLRCAALSASSARSGAIREALDFTATRRLAVAAERSGVAAFLIRLGGARQSQRRADALADRERAVPEQRSRPSRAGAAGVGCRAVPRARPSAGSLEQSRMIPPRMLSIWLPQLAIERWAKSADSAA